jgi:ABC-type branched-subunit amino acid transport system substrate-binding protein
MQSKKPERRDAMKALNLRKWASVIFTIAVLLSMSTGSVLAGDTVRIGVIGPMTGPAADTGREIKYASILAADEINSQGGILGKKIELIYGDTESNPSTGVTEVIKLIEREKVEFITGGLHSDVALAVMEVPPKYGIPYIISGPVSQSIADKIEKDKTKYKLVFKTDTSSLAYGSAWGEFNGYLKKNNYIKKEKVTYVMIIENTDYGRAVAAAAEAAMEKLNFKKLYTEIIDHKTADFYPILSKVQKAKPDILWSVQTATASGLALIKQFREMKIKALFQSTYVSTKPDYVKLVGADGVGVIAVQSAGLLPGNSDQFVEKIEKRWEAKPGMVAGIQYDVFYMIKSAAEKAGTLEPNKFIKEYAKTKHTGNLGTYVYDPKNNQIRSGMEYLPYLVFQFQEAGKSSVLIYPEKYTSARFKMPSWME